MAEILKIEDCGELSGIYKINFPNEKAYIGKAVDIRKRMNGHNSGNEQLVDKKIKQYLGKVEEIEILERIDKADTQKMNEREQYWIAYYNTFKDKTKGYNLTPGGDGAAYGIDNPSAKLDNQQLNKIYDLLINHKELYIYQIAERYNISPETISEINLGNRYTNLSFTYPLREPPKMKVGKGLDNHLTKFTEESLSEIYNLLINDNTLSLRNIAEKFNVSYGTISNINRGLRYRKEGYIYPLRKKNKNANFKLSDNEIEEIYNLLKNTKISMKKIGEQFEVSQDTIIRINKGINYTKDNYIYPIRIKGVK